MKMRILIVMIVAGFLANLQAQGTSYVPAAFVDVGLGARPAAMGGAFTGLADDIHALFWNPAGLSGMKSKQATVNFAKLYGLVSYNMFSVGMPLSSDESQQGFGLALISSGDDALREMTILAGYARKVGPFSLGLNLKYRHASFGNNTLNRDDFKVFSDDEFTAGVLNQVKGTASGFGFDFGLLYQLNEKIKMGFIVRDVYSPVSWNSSVDNPNAKTKGTYSETVPLETVIGTSYSVFENLLVTADYQPGLSDDVSHKVRGGAELRLWKWLYLRAGLQNNINTEDDERYLFGMGLAVSIKGSIIQFDYTHIIEQLENSNRITVGFAF
jgi:long-subunit fatty acid transport protein